ncbi:histidine kinase [Frankia tisae]|uniref:histidine kinase n=1 Tax=Frankia tisae TaxID=2950104 RepID=UPI0021C02805|nr:histidine kinase [Frankia tisae]
MTTQTDGDEPASTTKTVPARTPACPDLRRPGPEGCPPAPSFDLLHLMVALQERGHRSLTERMHDGPMQEFTAVLLDLASVRRRLSGDLADRVGEVENHLRAATNALQLPPGVFRFGYDARQSLTAGLTLRIAGLLVDRLDTDLQVDEHPPTHAEISVVLATAQLLLQASDPVGTGEHAWLAVRSAPAEVSLLLRVRPRAYEPPADAARAARLRPVADLIGVELRHDASTGGWSAAFRLDRPSA